mmetsp:Transcript_15147/g.21604  ORF Transcript_15147/g.21604 Transcript_15147/m.21604 type:complete len:400 (-) Transcript_15147:1800-2999(-)
MITFPNFGKDKKDEDFVINPHFDDDTDQSHRSVTSVSLTDGELDEVLTSFRNQNPKEKTPTRNFVEQYLIDKKWYNPNAGKKEPSLEKAWIYYEYITLGRRYNDSYKRADVGDRRKKSFLYPILKTPQHALKEWGIGVGLYFSSLKIAAAILLIAGCISIPNMIFFGSTRYGGSTHNHDDAFFLLKGSSLCISTESAKCEDGFCNTTLMHAKGYNFKETDEGVVEVIRSSCDGTTWSTGMISYGTMIFVIIATIIWSLYEQRLVTKEDEAIQTTSDYSIQVNNPPGDATNPEEWKDFFDQFAIDGKLVTLCTIAIDNYELLTALRDRRDFQNKLRNLLQGVSDEDFEDEEKLTKIVDKHIEVRDQQELSCVEALLNFSIIPLLRPLGFFPTAEILVEKN